MLLQSSTNQNTFYKDAALLATRTTTWNFLLIMETYPEIPKHIPFDDTSWHNNENRLLNALHPPVFRTYMALFAVQSPA